MCEPIRVLQMIGSLDIGGSQTMILNLYRAMDRCKIQFDFILDHPNEDALIPEVKALGARIFIMPSFKGSNFFEIKKAWDKFFDEHHEYKILHSHVRSYASVYIPIAKKHGVFTIIHSHSTSNGRGLSSVVKAVMQYPLRYQADYFMACSEIAGTWLYGRSIDNKKNYKIISNAIDAKRFNYDEVVRNKVRKELGLVDKFVIGHVGRITEPKNHSFLLDVFEEIVKQKSNAVLLLVGDGELRQLIDDKVKEKKLENKVVFLGSQSNTQDYYQAMDVFVFPSLWEGLGIVAIEAQTSGLHCVVSDRVPREIDLGAGLVEFISLEAGMSNWVNAILNTDIEKRVGKTEEVRVAGYDVTENAKKMMKFYLSVDKKMR